MAFVFGEEKRAKPNPKIKRTARMKGMDAGCSGGSESQPDGGETHPDRGDNPRLDAVGKPPGKG